MTDNTISSCQDRVQSSFESTLDDLEKIFRAYEDGETDRYIDEIGTFPEYGLSFDYVANGTFSDQHGGYFRYQLSWGGPSTEFRFYVDPDYRLIRAEYWFLDWFDGAHIDCTFNDTVRDIWTFFRDCDAEHVFRIAMEETPT